MENKIKELEEKLLRKEQECEELKERLVRTEEDLKYQCVDCMNVKSDRYRKALEEIEAAIATYSSKHQYSIANDLYNQILDIINKAKPLQIDVTFFYNKKPPECSGGCSVLI